MTILFFTCLVYITSIADVLPHYFVFVTLTLGVVYDLLIIRRLMQ